MPRIPEQIVDQIYNAIDIVEVIGEYVSLKKKGASYWGLSPFKNEKTPSFCVTPAKGIYKDFSSGKGGNAINFVMEMEGFEYPEALRHLAKKYGIEIPEVEASPEVKAERNHRQSLYVLNEFAARFFQDQLHKTDEGRQIGLSYFKERGLLQATIETFELGYAPRAWDSLSQAAIEGQYKEEYIEEVGLATRSEKTNKLVDRFRERVMFPIHNPTGKVVGFGGRLLASGSQMAKYINSPESEIYHKSEVLYGLYQARLEIRNADLCILTEGYMDVILLHQNGIRNVVASSGTALTPDQVRLIRRFTKKVLMIYDGDDAGIKAALRGIDLLVREGMQAKVLVLPDGHDPDSYVREHGPSGFREVMETAQDFVSFKMQALTAGRDPKDPQVQTEIIRAIADTIAGIPNDLERQMYIRHVAEQVGLSESLMTGTVDTARKKLFQELQREQRRQSSITQQPAETKDLRGFDTLDLAHQEKELLRVLVNHYDKMVEIYPDGRLEDEEGNDIEPDRISVPEIFQTEIAEYTFENKVFNDLKNEILECYQEGRPFNIHKYLNHPDTAICHLVSDLLTIPEISQNWHKYDALTVSMDHDLMRSLNEAIYHYKYRKVNRLLDELIKRMEGELTEEEEEKLMRAYQRLLEQRRQIHAILGTEGAIAAQGIQNH